MTSTWQQLAAPVARGLLSFLFLLSSLGMWASWDPMVKVLDKEVPGAPVVLGLAIVTQLLGGFSVLLGYRARWGAWLLIAYLAADILLFHRFWSVRGPEQVEHMMHVLKNLAIMGGLLQIVLHGPGAWSLDASLDRPE
jgi:putative oxidoreductase